MSYDRNPDAQKVIRMSQRALAEQDYWLSFSDSKRATQEERIEFFLFDSRGGGISPANPILAGKKRHGQYGEMMRNARCDVYGGWVGGLALLETYQHRQPCGLRPLIEWFGWETCAQWAKGIFR